MSFYVLTNPDEGDNDAVTDYEYGFRPRVGKAPLCPKCHEPVALREWLPPFKVWLRFWDKRHGDIAYGSSDMVVSDRFRTLFERSQLTGLDIIGPAIVTKVFPRRMEANLPQYWIARVRRARAAIDHSA